MALQLVTAPATQAVSRADVKAHLRVEHTDHDGLIDSYIAAETAYAEDFTGRALVPQTWDYWQDAFPAECDPQVITLPLGKVTAVADVFYLDADGVEQTWDAANYDADLASVPARIRLADNASWPTTYDGMNAVRVRFTAGSADTGASPPAPDVMADIQLAIKLRVQADYIGGDDGPRLREIADGYLRRRRVHLALG